MNTIGGNTPERFQGALEMAKRRMLSKPGGPRILNIKCWNEWTEGSYLLLGLALGGVALVLAPTVDAGETGASETVNYARPFEPPTRPAFLALPPGAIEPDGWLRDWRFTDPWASIEWAHWAHDRAANAHVFKTIEAGLLAEVGMRSHNLAVVVEPPGPRGGGSAPGPALRGVRPELRRLVPPRGPGRPGCGR